MSCFFSCFRKIDQTCCADTKKIDPKQALWNIKSAQAKRDLVIKTVALTLLALINLAVLGIALYLVVLYTPLPTNAVFASPFIVGALAALSYLKFPTCGITSMNYSSFLNPTYLVGKTIAYLFFGPLMYAIDRADWTPYHSPIQANKISGILQNDSFEVIAETFAPHYYNLVKYGFIPKKYGEDFLQLCQTYTINKRALNYWKEADSRSSEYRQAVQTVEDLNENWNKLKSQISVDSFPHPENPKIDFSKHCSMPLILSIRAYL